MQGTCTITEHIRDQALVWALAGENKTSAQGGVYTQHSVTRSGLCGGPWVRRFACMISRTPASFCRGPEKLSHFVQVSEPESPRAGLSLPPNLICLPCYALPPAAHPPCCPSGGLGRCPQCCGEASGISWAPPSGGGWKPWLLKGKREE